MPPSPGSRFAGLPLHSVRGPDGEVRTVVALRLTGEQPAGERVHRVTHGDQVDRLAAVYFGDERLWWRLLDANPLRYPLDVPPGDLLRLPPPEQVTRASRARSF